MAAYARVELHIRLDVFRSVLLQFNSIPFFAQSLLARDFASFIFIYVLFFIRRRGCPARYGNKTRKIMIFL